MWTSEICTTLNVDRPDDFGGEAAEGAGLGNETLNGVTGGCCQIEGR